jgi:hypothetical protein
VCEWNDHCCFMLYVKELGLGRRRRLLKMSTSKNNTFYLDWCSHVFATNQNSLRPKWRRRTSRRTKCTKGRVEVQIIVEGVEPRNGSQDSNASIVALFEFIGLSERARRLCRIQITPHCRRRTTQHQQHTRYNSSRQRYTLCMYSYCCSLFY